MVIFHSYVKLPEGISSIKWLLGKSILFDRRMLKVVSELKKMDTPLGSCIFLSWFEDCYTCQWMTFAAFCKPTAVKLQWNRFNR